MDRNLVLASTLLVLFSHGGLSQEQSEPITNLKLGFISPTSGPFGYRTTASATTMGIQNCQKDGYLKGVNVT